MFALSVNYFSTCRDESCTGGNPFEKECMHMKKRVNGCRVGMAAALILLLTMAGCSPAGQAGLKEADTRLSGKETQTAGQADMEPVSKEVFAMDTYMTLTAYGDRADEALDTAEEEINRIESLLSTGIDTSEISQINRTGEAQVSGDTACLIERSKELYKDTGGIFDITIYPVMKAWGFTDQNYRIPGQDELDALLANMGADQISLAGDRVKVEKEGMEIDLGGIAKGYTSERVMEIFKEYGIEHAVVSLGGNVQTLHDKPDGSAWRVAVEDPENTSSYIGVLSVKDKAVITSGGYERYFEEDGQTYHHIIDPATGYPARSGLTSVTVVSEDGTLADGLSTSLFIMGRDRAETYWKDHRDLFDMILVEEDGSVSVTDGIADAFDSEKKWKLIGE